jgi:hypothetical protein
MQGSMVSWRDYQGLTGLGQTSVADVAELRKALAAGQDINAPAAAAGEGFPLRMESLENTFKLTTFKMGAAKCWQGITKIPAFNTVFSTTYDAFANVRREEMAAW